VDEVEDGTDMVKLDAGTYGYVAEDVRVGMGRCVAVVSAVFAGACIPAALASCLSDEHPPAS
jgi:hypothetical protein